MNIVRVLAVVLSIAPLLQTANAEVLGWSACRRSFWLPGVASVDGYNGTKWKTDLRLLNLDSSRTSVVEIVEMRSMGYGQRVNILLDPREELNVADVLQTLFQRDGLAVLAFNVEGFGVEVEAITHSGTACGASCGTTLSPAVVDPFRESSLLGYFANFPLNVAAGSRVNLGFANFSDGNALVEWIILDGAGGERSSGSLTISENEVLHVPASVGSLPLHGGRVTVKYTIEARSGEHFFPYVVVTNSATNQGRIHAMVHLALYGKAGGPLE